MYDGTLDSLAERSRRPHSHPNQHTTEELKLISDMRRRNLNAGLVVFWAKLMQRGYKRSIPSLWRVLKRLSLQPIKLPNPKYIAKPYEKMLFPGQRVQVDVKIVPLSCIVPNADGLQEWFYQYTAIDEYSRFRFIMAFKEQSTYSSVQFLNSLIKAFPFNIECIQTDNGLEFIKSFDDRKKGKFSLFEARLKELGIRHKLIRPFTPRHNGKVERSHRKDNEYFEMLKKMNVTFIVHEKTVNEMLSSISHYLFQTETITPTTKKILHSNNIEVSGFLAAEENGITRNVLLKYRDQTFTTFEIEKLGCKLVDDTVIINDNEIETLVNEKNRDSYTKENVSSSKCNDCFIFS